MAGLVADFVVTHSLYGFDFHTELARSVQRLEINTEACRNTLAHTVDREHGHLFMLLCCLLARRFVEEAVMLVAHCSVFTLSFVCRFSSLIICLT